MERDADHLEGKIGSRWKDLDDLEFESGLCQNLERKKVLFEWYGELKTSQLRKIELVEEVFPAYELFVNASLFICLYGAPVHSCLKVLEF